MTPNQTWFIYSALHPGTAWPQAYANVRREVEKYLATVPENTEITTDQLVEALMPEAALRGPGALKARQRLHKALRDMTLDRHLDGRLVPDHPTLHHCCRLVPATRKYYGKESMRRLWHKPRPDLYSRLAAEAARKVGCLPEPGAGFSTVVLPPHPRSLTERVDVLEVQMRLLMARIERLERFARLLSPSTWARIVYPSQQNSAPTTTDNPGPGASNTPEVCPSPDE